MAATADVSALVKFANSRALVFAKVPAPEGAPPDSYTIDHSATIAVLDPQGRMAGIIQQPLQPRAIAADLAALTQVSSSNPRHSRRQGPSAARGSGVGVRARFPLSTPTPSPLPFGYNTPHEPAHHPQPRPPAPPAVLAGAPPGLLRQRDRKSTRLNSSH